MKDGNNEFELSVTSNDETTSEDNKEQNRRGRSHPLAQNLNLVGADRKRALRTCLIKTTAVIYALILLVLLYELFIRG